MIAPLLEAYAVDGAARLLGAHGAYAPLASVELEARRLEDEPAELRHPAHTSLETVDDVLVVHPQYFSGQNAVCPSVR